MLREQDESTKHRSETNEVIMIMIHQAHVHPAPSLHGLSRGHGRLRSSSSFSSHHLRLKMLPFGDLKILAGRLEVD